MFKSRLSIWAHCWTDQQVSLSCSYYPSSIDCHVNRFNWISKSRQECFCILTNFFIHSNWSIKRTNGKSTGKSGGYLAKLWISFINFRLGCFLFFINSWIDSINSSMIDSDECVFIRSLGIFPFLSNVSH